MKRRFIRGLSHAPKVLRGIFLFTSFNAVCLAVTMEGAEPAKQHPWLPPFDFERVGQTASTNDFEADAIARPQTPTNPVDLGTLLVPHGWLLLGPRQPFEVEVAAISRRGDQPDARLRVWFGPDWVKGLVAPFPLADRTRAQRVVSVPSAPATPEHELLHLAIETSNNAVVLWQKDIPVMIVPDPPHWPRFGATATKLRYDAPISVRHEGGTFSSLDYAKGWDPSLQDVVVSLPTGTRFVFWRGSCYVPFWADSHNTCLSYEWAETLPPKDGYADCVEPLMDKELRYGRVEIVESTEARVHVRWTYQSCDFKYKVWGDSAVEDFYFYPDGFGTRVLTLQSALDSNYELSEFIILTPQDAYPFSVLPEDLVKIIFLDGESRTINFPYSAASQGEKMKSRDLPCVYRVKLHKDDSKTAVYFNSEDRKLPPAVFGPFKDAGSVVTPCYWGSHWPLARGQTTGGAINERIHSTPAHNSVMSWTFQRPPALREEQIHAPDTLGRSKPMRIQTWAWLIGLTDVEDSNVLDRAKSFSSPPSVQMTGARLEGTSYAQERRAIRLIAESPVTTITMTPSEVCVNPVFEIRHAPSRLLRASLNEVPLPAGSWAWDGKVLWLNVTLRAQSTLRLEWGKGKSAEN